MSGTSSTAPAASRASPKKSLMLAGDQNMMEVNAVVHYRSGPAGRFLLPPARWRSHRARGGRRRAGHRGHHHFARRHAHHRPQAMEARVKSELQARLDRYGAGVEVLHVQLLDVHPSLEVVDAFREVSGAYEEKNRLINEAEGYRNEQVALARGNAKALIAGRRGLFARQARIAPMATPARFTAARSRLSRRTQASRKRGCTWKRWSRCCPERRK